MNHAATIPLADWLTHRAANTPERTAIVAAGREWTYRELDDAVTHTARRLASLGVSAGDRIAILLGNRIEIALLVHAALRLEVTIVPLNTRLGEAELAWQIGDSRAVFLVTEARMLSLCGQALRDNPALITVSVDDDGAATFQSPRLENRNEIGIGLSLIHDPAHVLAIVYTSGTTGRPKGAMLTVGNFWWSAVGSALNLGTLASDRWLACMPLFHVGGLSILIRSAIYGITAIVHDGFDATSVNASIDAGDATIVSVVAVMLQRMLDARADRPFPASLRCVLLGGGPAPRTLLERCVAIGVPVAQTYGLTETTSQLATLAPEDALRKLGAAGRPIYPNEIRIVQDDREVQAGEPGEIVVRGPVVMAGYSGQPEATARAIVDGWLRTGDTGSLDADGYLTVLDRRDDLIITGGENVYPAEVEAVLLAHPLVAEAAVIGVPDSTWGQSVVAFVCIREGGPPAAAGVEDALRDYCRAHLASYKVPRQLRLAAEPLPRTASGKLRRAALRDRLAQPAPGID